MTVHMSPPPFGQATVCCGTDLGELREGDHASLDPALVTCRVDPDCIAGKHRACLGNAWDEENDEPCDCGCPCHREGTAA